MSQYFIGILRSDNRDLKGGAMYFIRLLGAAIFFSTAIFGQVTLSGKVTNAASGNGLPGVELKLLAAGLTVTTNATGNYAFNGSPIQNHRPLQSTYIQYSAGILTFRQIEEQAQVQIDLLNVQGKILNQLINKQLEKGLYTLGISREGLAPQMYLLKISINHIVHYVPVSLVEYSSTAALSRVNDDSKGLSKSTAVIDTLTLRANGFGFTKVPIDSYTGIKDVMLTALSAWNNDTNTFWGPRGSAIPLPTKNIVYKFLNRTNGAWPDDSIWWEAGGVLKSLKEQSTIDMGGGSGRVNFYIGQSKAKARYVDFIEHTIGGSWNGNTTRVDWYGFPIAIRLHSTDGYDRILGENYDVFFMGRKKFFDLYKSEVPEKFVHLAEVNGDKWIVCPGSGEFKATGKYKDYYSAYVDSVWAKWNITTEKPTTEQIFRCNGKATGGDPQMCGALNRHMGMYTRVIRDKIPTNRTDTWWDVKKFYQGEPANHYSAFLHRYSFENLSYGFAYDDDADQQAFMSHDKTHYLLVAIGF